MFSYRRTLLTRSLWSKFLFASITEIFSSWSCISLMRTWKRESDMSSAPRLNQASSFTKEDNRTIQSDSTLLAYLLQRIRDKGRLIYLYNVKMIRTCAWMWHYFIISRIGNCRAFEEAGLVASRLQNSQCISYLWQNYY